MIDHIGFNSFFLTITPDDECSFQVRLYDNPDHKVCIYHTNRLYYIFISDTSYLMYLFKKIILMNVKLTTISGHTPGPNTLEHVLWNTNKSFRYSLTVCYNGILKCNNQKAEDFLDG
jgi:hypothetical protein